MLKHLSAAFVVVFLVGCDSFSDAEPMMSEYLERLGRVLETSPAEVQALPAARSLPRRRERLLEMPELELGMLDFLSLYRCELQYVVGEKNSVMGRVMQPINRLRYEIRFIRAAEDCLPEIRDEELRDTLRAAVDSKRDSLPRALWNATWGTEEIERLVTLSKGYFPVGEGSSVVSDLVRDLEQLNRIVENLNNQRLDQSLDSLGAIQQRWQAEFRAGQLINSARLLIATLDAGTRTLQARLEERPLCLNGKPNNQSDIVRNFFFSIYIEKIQPYMSDVSRAGYELIGELERLAGQQASVMPESFRPWHQRYLTDDSQNSLWQELDDAMALHTRHWQELLGQCGLRPEA
ncbi:MAG: DUF3080 domain-containing protein [Pseudomonadota bacterium]